jgi:beta-mannosidase
MGGHRSLYFSALAASFALWSLFCFAFSNLDSTEYMSSMVRRSTQAILAGSVATVALSQQVLDLSTIDWTLTSPNFSSISVPAKIPSQAHLDLYAAQVHTIHISQV